MHLSINYFRAFKEIENIKIAPLTILVGENSAGKTSFLAAVRLIYEVFSSPELASFNKEPFLLGAYDQIAHFRGGKSGRAPKFNFKIELDIIVSPGNYYFAEPNGRKTKGIKERVSCEIQFVNEFSTPALEQIHMEYEGGSITIAYASGGTILVKTGDFEKSLDENSLSITFKDEGLRARNLVRTLEDLPFILLRQKEFKPKDKKTLDTLDKICARFRALRRAMAVAVYASAPVRTEPGRAYTPLDASPTPQGGHVPYLLARLKRHDLEKWNILKSKIDAFGQSAGIFDKIDVKNLGRSESDPFQIYFDFGGPKRNIIDVGYGVSQVLPVITEVMSRDTKTIFLFQQPEVHLHPQAQAALGTFFAKEITHSKHSFIIESHSDFIIDRIRMAVRDKSISSDAVSILYFQRGRLESNLFEISIDGDGNILNSPPGYRSFFLQEELNSVGP